MVLGDYQFGRLCASYREFQVRVLFPVSEQKGEFGKKTIIYLASSNDGLRARVAVETALERFSSAD